MLLVGIKVFQNGRNVRWRTRPEPDPELSGVDPFSRTNPGMIVNALPLIITSNFSLLTGTGTNPTIYLGRKSWSTLIWPPVRIVPLHEESSWYLITPYSVQRSNSSEKTLVAPMNGSFLLAFGFIAISTTVVIVAIAALESGTRFELWTSILGVMSWMAMVMIEVSTIVPLREVNSTRLLRFMLALWLLLALYVTNIYKSLITSEASSFFPYVTPCTSLLDTENMKIYFFVDESDCERFTKAKKEAIATLNNSAEFYALTCPWLEYESYEDPSCRFFARLFHRMLAAGHDDIHAQLYDLRVRLDFVCPSNLDRIILERQDKRLLFVVTEDEFDYYWNIFKGKMQSQRFLKFAYNKESRQDIFYGSISAIVATGGLDSGRDGVTGRVRAMLSSGIYSLWVRWEKLKFLRHQIPRGQFVKETEDSPQPLSLANSDTQTILGGMLGALGTAFIVFLCENLVSCSKQATLAFYLLFVTSTYRSA